MELKIFVTNGICAANTEYNYAMTTLTLISYKVLYIQEFWIYQVKHKWQENLICALCVHNTRRLVTLICTAHLLRTRHKRVAWELIGPSPCYPGASRGEQFV